MAMLSFGGETNPKNCRPSPEKGKPIVRTRQSPVKLSKAKEGFEVFKKLTLLLTEKIKTSSVRMLSINQLV